MSALHNGFNLFFSLFIFFISPFFVDAKAFHSILYFLHKQRVNADFSIIYLFVGCNFTLLQIYYRPIMFCAVLWEFWVFCSVFQLIEMLVREYVEVNNQIFVCGFFSLSYLFVDEMALDPFIFVACFQWNTVHASLTAVVTGTQPIFFNTFQCWVTPWEEVSRHLTEKLNRLAFGKWWTTKENRLYPLPSGARSWMTRFAHKAGTGGSKIRPFGNWAKDNPSNELKHTIATNVFILFASFLNFDVWKNRKNVEFEITFNKLTPGKETTRKIHHLNFQKKHQLIKLLNSGKKY